MIEELSLADWPAAPCDAALRTRAVMALEAGAVLFFPQLSFGLLDSEKQFLDAAVSDGKSKNVSLDHTTGRLQATSLTGEPAAQLAAMIERFGQRATTLVEALLPYRAIERARTSYRPVQVQGRSYSKISDDRLLHVDAFPTRPMHGRRILRVFANVAPASSRHWHVGEPFEQFAQDFLPRIRAHVPGRSWLFEKLGVTRGRRSRYDEMMLSLHDAAKRDDAFQQGSPHQAVSFPPNTCWMVFTDQVLHAALGGEFALEQTFHFGIDQMADPSSAPVKVLERLSGQVLV